MIRRDAQTSAFQEQSGWRRIGCFSLPQPLAERRSEESDMRVLVGRLPHAGKGVYLVRGASPFLSSSSFPSFTTRATSVPKADQGLPHQFTAIRNFATTGARPCPSDIKMASEDPKDVRKYLQQSHDRIFENNKKWADEQRAKHPEFFEKLSAGQSPEYLWIGESITPHHQPRSLSSHTLRPEQRS